METLCLAELLAGMSVVADIGMGLEQGEAARAALVAVELAIAVGAPDPSDVYYTTLLQHIGCTAYAHEAAALLGGDEIAVKRAAMRTDFGNPGEVLRGYLPSLAPTARLSRRTCPRALRSPGVARANRGDASRAARCLGLSPPGRRLSDRTPGAPARSG